MAFNFPSNPAEGETIQAGRFSFQYSGGKWNSVLANPQFVDIQGATGPEGPVGGPGPQGATGEPGPEGPAGSPGPAASVGATGSEGPVGATGETGAQGPQGATGLTGATGQPGSPATNAATIDVQESADDSNGYAVLFTDNIEGSGPRTIQKDSLGLVYNPDINELGTLRFRALESIVSEVGIACSTLTVSTGIGCSDLTATNLIVGNVIAGDNVNATNFLQVHKDVSNVEGPGRLDTGAYGTREITTEFSANEFYAVDIAGYSRMQFDISFSTDTEINFTHDVVNVWRSESDGFQMSNWADSLFAIPDPIDGTMIASTVVDDTVLGIYYQRDAINPLILRIGCYTKIPGTYNVKWRVDTKRYYL